MLLSKSELINNFQKPLPGIDSHLKMAPKPRVSELLQTKDKIPTARQSAVMILLFPDNGQLKTVFIKRSEYDGIHSGQIAFPGGQYEESDDNFKTTALRETFEEIGVSSDKIEIIGQLTDLFIPPSNFVVKAFAGYCKQKPKYVSDKKEVQTVIEVAIDELADEQYKHEKEFISGQGESKIRAPYFHIQNIEIWGATAMIVSELLDILKL
jgi:8-oxo-dGTP pyrophosphatase MutT (NUDIX family)